VFVLLMLQLAEVVMTMVLMMLGVRQGLELVQTQQTGARRLPVTDRRHRRLLVE